MIEATRELWQRTPFRWGEHDCIMAVCNHVYVVTGIDPAAPWRGTYADEEGAKAIYSAHGGVLALFAHGMRQAGFPQGQPADGAPVGVRIGSSEVVGIVMGRRIGFVDWSGLVEARVPVSMAWPL